MEKQKTDYDIRFKGWLNEHGVVVGKEEARDAYVRYCTEQSAQRMEANKYIGASITCKSPIAYGFKGFESFLEEGYIRIYDDYYWPIEQGNPWEEFSMYLHEECGENDDVRRLSNELSLLAEDNALLVEQINGFFELDLDGFALWKHRMEYDHNHAPGVGNKALSMVRKERQRQDVLWGSNRILAPSMWLSILVEEVGEVATEVMEYRDKYGKDKEGLKAEQRYIDEVTQVAAVAVAMLESILLLRDSRENEGQPQKAPGKREFIIAKT